MLVKKINPEWTPSENKDLKVGETIDVSNPETLIKSGTVVAVDANGIEISAYELYGIVTDLDRKGFEEYLEWKKLQDQKRINERFVQEAQELRKQILEQPAEEKKVEEVAVTEESKKDDTKAKRIAALEKARAARKKK